MMTYARNIARHEFESEVLKSRDGKLCVVDFWAPWCGPCKVMEPILEKIAQQNEYKFNVYKINVEDERDLSAMIGVRSIPTLMFFKNGQKIDLFVGALTEQKLMEEIRKHL